MTKENKTKEIVKSPVVRQNNSSSGNSDYVGFKFSKKGDKRRIETFEGRRENDGRVFENRRIWRDDFVSPPTEERESTVTIEEIDGNEEIGEKDTGLNNDRLPINDSKAIDNGGASQSNKRQQTDDKENGSVKKSKGEDIHNNQSSLKRKGKRSEVKGEENKNSQESNSSKISSVETNNHKEAVVNPNNSSVSDSSSKVGVVAVFATFCAVLTGGIVGVRR